MANELALHLNKYLTQKVKKEAQKILLANKPSTIKYLVFHNGEISLNGRGIRSYIPKDLYISGCMKYLGHFIRGIAGGKFIPDSSTAISIYFYCIRPYITEDEYYTWLRNIMVNHYGADIIKKYPCEVKGYYFGLLEKLSSTVIFDTDIDLNLYEENKDEYFKRRETRSSLFYNDALRFHEWLDRQLIQK